MQCYPLWVITLGYLLDSPAGKLSAMQLPEVQADKTVVRRWPRRAQCVGLARAELLRVLTSWDLSADADTAALVLSELLTNAIRHARVSPGREIETRFVRNTAGLRIEVHDAADERPLLRSPGPESPSGRGLLLVDALADAWDTETRDGIGKVVWAQINSSEKENDCVDS